MMTPVLRITRLPRAFVRKALNATGYQIHRRPEGDALLSQRRLLQLTHVEVIFDVGAYVGDVARQYKELFPTAVIHCFEPFRPSYLELQRRVGSFAQVHEVGIAETSGVRVLNVNGAAYTNSILKVAEGSGAFVDSSLTAQIDEVEVKVASLDDFCRDNEIAEVQILKLDIQGAELAALRGAQRLLAGAAIDLIYLEVNFAPVYENQAALCDLEDYLLPFGYQLAGLFDPVITRSGAMAWVDAIFVAESVSNAPEWRWR